MGILRDSQDQTFPVEGGEISPAKEVVCPHHPGALGPTRSPWPGL